MIPIFSGNIQKKDKNHYLYPVKMTDETYLKRALYLASLGKGNVAPNPLVGSVIVCDGKIIGEGYHQKHGKAHAEVNAIHSVQDKSLLSKSTLYVNLEPCAHFGKTPPCSNLIIEYKIPKVVIGCIDSFSEVAGKGIERMKKAGIDVTVGVLEKESLEINKQFFTFHTNKRPYIILKWAQSANSFMDIERAEKQKGIFWITQPETKSLVHKWRAESAGILVGRQTIENDNPSLTCRDYEGNNPTRFVLDKNLKTNYTDLTISKDGVKTYIFNSLESTTVDNITFIKLPDFSLDSILHEIYKLDIQSIIVEGGKYTLDQFIDANLWDEARVLTGIGTIDNGTKSPSINGKVINDYMYGKDSVKIYTT